MSLQTLFAYILLIISNLIKQIFGETASVHNDTRRNTRKRNESIEIESNESFDRQMATFPNAPMNTCRNRNANISFSEPINLERQIIEKIQEEKICVNSYVRRDFSELTIVKKGVRPKQLSTTLKVYASKYSEGSAQHSALQSIILELDTAGGDDGEDLSGRSKIEQVAAVQGTGELTATFVIYQYRHNHNTNKLLVDALVISGTQRLSVDWMELATEASIGILPILLNPAVGVVEIGALVAGGLHALGNRHKIKAATTEINAKALLFKLLIDKGIAKIEDGKYYLMLD